MIAILHYQSGQIEKLQAAFSRIAAPAKAVRSIDDLQRATRIVFPPCNSFPDAIRDLRDNAFLPLLFRAMDNNVPILGIDQGMHLFFDVCYIDGQHTGLGAIPGKVEPVEPGARHCGMQTVRCAADHPLLNGLRPHADFYFDNSHLATPLDNRAITAESQNGQKHVACVAEKNLMGVQFRPEDSGDAGLILLQNFAKL